MEYFHQRRCIHLATWLKATLFDLSLGDSFTNAVYMYVEYGAKIQLNFLELKLLPFLFFEVY